MPNERALLWKVSEPERKEVAFTIDHDPLPPAVVRTLVEHHHVTNTDGLPTAGQARSHWRDAARLGRRRVSLVNRRLYHCRLLGRACLDLCVGLFGNPRSFRNLVVEVATDIGNERLPAGVNAPSGQFHGDV